MSDTETCNTIIPRDISPNRTIRSGLLDRLGRKVLLNRLGGLDWGRIIIEDAGERLVFGRHDDPLQTVVHVDDPRFYGAAVFGGSIGAAEAFMAGYWRCSDLTALFRIMVRNQSVMANLEKGPAVLTAPLHKLFHVLHRNTRSGSRQNIAAHYDLGNDFYRLFLDETMTYSSGIFLQKDSTLTEASLAKYERICRKLDLQPEDQILEIGTGWGGFALHAARHYGCRVTTTTISREQHDHACRQVSKAGLTDRITLLRQDYRDLSGCYDKLVSIEMIEAVGHRFLPTFFRCCSNLLKPDGLLLIQAITFPDHLYEAYRHTVDFINRYIFPGSCIPSLTALSQAAARASDLRLVNLEDITPHYARTLRAWRTRFLHHREDVRSLGYPESFCRMWEYYLCYCEGGFEERYIGDVQLLFAKPDNRRMPFLPPLTDAQEELP